MLDNQLIPAAEDDPVREHLTTTRDTIAAHLEQAQALQSQ
jgi:putative membrane protein